MFNFLKIINSSLGFILIFTFYACSQVENKTINEPTKKQYTKDFTISKVYTTVAKDTIKLQLTAKNIPFSGLIQPLETEASILINPSKQYQTFLGIGAALTDAAAETFYKLPKTKQEQFMEAYFDKEKGIAYSLARTIIHSCDFSSETYTYVKEGDHKLTSFSINHDKQFRIPFKQYLHLEANYEYMQAHGVLQLS